MRGAPRSVMASQRGVALIIVIWIGTLLTLVASSFIYAMRSDIHVVGNSLSRARLDAAASAGVQRAVLEMAKPLQLAGRWSTDGQPQTWEYAGATMNISITDESAKVDLNAANEALLRGLFQSQGLAAEEAAALTDALMDWKDPDTLKRLRGAEEPEYLAAGLGYKPANAPFQSIEELRLVLGMTPALYQRLAPLITIYSRQPGINSAIAGREVLRALPGVTEAQIDEFLVRRETARANKQPIPVFPSPFATSFSATNIAQVRVEAALDDGSTLVREATVLRLPNPKRSFTYLRWREGRAGEVNAPNVAPAGNEPAPKNPSAQT